MSKPTESKLSNDASAETVDSPAGVRELVMAEDIGTALAAVAVVAAGDATAWVEPNRPADAESIDPETIVVLSPSNGSPPAPLTEREFSSLITCNASKAETRPSPLTS